MQSCASPGLAYYHPLDWEIQPFQMPAKSDLRACAGYHDMELGLACGSYGKAVWLEQGQASFETIAGKPHLTAAAIDVLGRGWAASPGQIWLRHKEDTSKAEWRCVWEEPRMVSPVVSLSVDVAVLLAVTTDGGVIEGRRSAVFS